MGHAIAFAQQKGGAGKTTLLAHLAHANAQKGASVALLDLDPQGSLSAWHGMAAIGGLTLLETATYRISGDIRDAKKDHDLVLVDCPGHAAPILEAAVREADLVLVPCQPTPLDLWATKPITDMADAEGVTARIILNRVPPRGNAPDETRSALKPTGAKICKTSLGNRIAYSRGIGQGGTALSLPGQQAAKGEIEALRKEIARVLKSAG